MSVARLITGNNLANKDTHARTLKEEVPFPLFLVAQCFQERLNLRIEDVSLFRLEIHIDRLAAAKMYLEILDNLFLVFCHFLNSRKKAAGEKVPPTV